MIPTVQLDEIAEVKLGRQRSPKDHNGDQMRPYVRAANVGWSGWKLDDVKTMNFTDAEMDIYRLEPGDLLRNLMGVQQAASVRGRLLRRAVGRRALSEPER